MKKLSWEEQKKYNINLEHLENIKEPSLTLDSNSEKPLKVEYELLMTEYKFNGVEFVDCTVNISKANSLQELIDDYINLKLSEEIGRDNHSGIIKRFVAYKIGDEIWKINDWTVDMSGPHSSDSNIITLKEWAEREGITDATARQKALRGSLKTAEKIGKQWFINPKEKNIDKRFKENK